MRSVLTINILVYQVFFKATEGYAFYICDKYMEFIVI